MRKMFLALLCAGAIIACNNDQKTLVKGDTVSGDKAPASEFADARYVDLGKSMMLDFETANFDRYANALADNVVYQWSSGDSLVGKQAVVDYWRIRRSTVVTDVKMSNQIWLPIKVNKSQSVGDVPGIWLLTWHQVAATYNNGKKLNFWAHQVMHYNNEDKVDRIVMYMDRAPIVEALNAK